MTQPRSAARTRSAKGRRAWQAAAILTAGALTALGLAAASAGASPPRGSYQQINMVSDQPGVAQLTDPDLVNAWGLSASPGTNAMPGSPLWVSDNGTDKTTLYAGRRHRKDGEEGPRVALRRCHFGGPDRSGIQHRLERASSCTTRPATPPRRSSSSTRRTVASTAGIPPSESPRLPGHHRR